MWKCIGEKGSSRDSTVFNESQFGKYLLENHEQISERGVYLVGDCTYALRNYLLVLYENDKPGSPEDSFNYYLSSNRIWVECAFGEIDRRWSIFWMNLEGSLEDHKYVIDSCLKLHNYLVEFREANKEHMEQELNFENELDIACDKFISLNPLELVDVMNEELNKEKRRVGRPHSKENKSREQGLVLRNTIKEDLHKNLLLWPSGNLGIVVQRDKYNRQCQWEHIDL